jgi:hypothetical protein
MGIPFTPVTTISSAWEISDIVALIPNEVPKKRGSYRKKVQTLD